MAIIHHNPHGSASRVTEFNGVLYFEIHVARDSLNNRFLSVYDQTKMLLSRFDGLLEEYGSDKGHILLAHILLLKRSMVAEFWRAWDEWVEDGYQPATFVSDSLTVEGESKVGMVLIAAKKDAEDIYSKRKC